MVQAAWTSSFPFRTVLNSCAVLGSATPQHIMRGRFVSATLGDAGQMLHAALAHPSGALWLDGAGHNDIEVFEGGIECTTAHHRRIPYSSTLRGVVWPQWRELAWLQRWTTEYGHSYSSLYFALGSSDACIRS